MFVVIDIKLSFWDLNVGKVYIFGNNSIQKSVFCESKAAAFQVILQKFSQACVR